MHDITFLCLHETKLADESIMFSSCPSVCLSVCPFVCYQTYEHYILKMNDPILVPVGISGQWGMGMTCSTFGIRRSNVKVTQGTKIGVVEGAFWTALVKQFFQKKLDPFSFEHNLGKYCPILIFFSLLQTEINCDQVYPKICPN